MEDLTLTNTSKSKNSKNSTATKTPQKKSKVAAKSTGEKYQFQIMQSSGVPINEIAKFADADYWLTYFPPLAIVS